MCSWQTSSQTSFEIHCVPACPVVTLGHGADTQESGAFSSWALGVEVDVTSDVHPWQEGLALERLCAVVLSLCPQPGLCWNQVAENPFCKTSVFAPKRSLLQPEALRRPVYRVLLVVP